MFNEKTKPYAYPTSFNHVLQFNSAIEEPELYAEFCDVLIGAQESDTVSIYFNTGGGSGATMVQLINLMNNCRAHIVGYLVNEASSAGSFLLLNCDEIHVGKYTEMLCHTVQFGSVGSYPEVRAHVDHVGKQTERLIRTTYKYFLTEDEINDVLYNNRQLYLDEDDICDRLDRRQKLLEKERETQQQGALNDMFHDLGEELDDKTLMKLTKKELVSYINGELDVVVDENGKVTTKLIENNS